MSTFELDQWPGDEPPVVAGEVVGWRAWAVLSGAGHREPRLRSLFRDLIWPTDDWLIADVAHARPEEARWIRDGTPHGICAARDREHLVSMHEYGDHSYPRYVRENARWGITCVAIGEVGLAGLIVPGERGYRAEKARVVSLQLPYAHWDLVDSLHRAYRVPVGLSNVLIEAGSIRGHRS